MTSVKGILKGLRYISQIFENEKEEEVEIQIGNPTDVKHVAHIGNEGPSSNAPSWMNDYQQGGLETGSGGQSGTGSRSNNSGKTKQQKRQAQKSSNGTISSPAREPSSNAKPRRNKNTNAESPRRQPQNTSAGIESPARELPKSSRPKKSKATNSKSKPQNSVTDNFASSPARGYDMDNTEMYQKSAS